MTKVAELVRVQLLLGKDDNEALVEEARRRGVSKSECVRQLIRDSVLPVDRLSDPFFQMIGSVTLGGPTDVSKNHDQYLYEDEVASWRKRTL
jgi:hypothetical protein